MNQPASGRTLSRISLIALFLALHPAVSACAASFDCDTATSGIETQICANPRLSVLDEELDQVYGEAMKRVSNPTALKNAQQRWIKKERNAFDEPASIEAAYLARIEELRLSPKTRGKLFARTAPPASIFGRYSEKEPVCVSIPDTDKYDCSSTATQESYVDIQPGPGKSVNVKSELIFFQGHTCKIQGRAEWVDGALRLPRLNHSRCVLQLRFKKGKVVAEDPANICTTAFCSALSGFQNIELPKTSAVTTGESSRKIP